MRRHHRFALLLCLPVLCAIALAQGNAGPQAAPPPNISGMYTFLHEGEFVQLSQDDAVLSGFISRYADDKQESFVDQLFRKASWDGKTLSFETRPAKDVWFAFSGSVVFSQDKKPEEEGYRTLRGTLTTYFKDADGKETSKAEAVEFHSFPGDEAKPD